MEIQKMLQEIYEKIADKTLSMGCNVMLNFGDKLIYTILNKHHIDCFEGKGIEYHDTESFAMQDIQEIIGHPISLSRVLSALGGFAIGVPSYIDENIVLSLKHHTKSNFKLTRKLLNEDNSDAILDDQSDETIESLHKLLVRK